MYALVSSKKMDKNRLFTKSCKKYPLLQFFFGYRFYIRKNAQMNEQMLKSGGFGLDEVFLQINV